MMTQFQTTEPQSALLAACPRPRALALPVPVDSVFMNPAFTNSVLTNSESASWSNAAPVAAASARVVGLGVVAVERRRSLSAEGVRPLGFAEIERPAAAERPVAEYAAVLPVPMTGARTEAMLSGNGGVARLTGTNGFTSSKQQDQQHLTARREPVTWRPPH